jgi:signal transduction histidine kinase
MSVALSEHAALSVYNYRGITYSEAQNEIIKRFSIVFQQAYTRFLDIQKAEAQAHEAQIELALERIRAQVTAMQESSDLLDIVVTMRAEFVKLGHEAHYFWHMRWLPETYAKAMTSGDGTKIGMVMSLPRRIHGDIKAVADWEKGCEPVHVLAMDAETAVDYIHKMVTWGDFERVDPQAPTLDDIRHIGGLTFVMARTTHGEIGYSLPGEVPDPPKDAVDTLVRFAGVFDLAYKRFEDLKATERQTREARIELALEKVRSRTMGMQRSDELADVANVLFAEMNGLVHNLWTCGFVLCERDRAEDEWWLSLEDGFSRGFFLPNVNDYAHATLYEGWLEGDAFRTVQLDGGKLQEHYDWLMQIPVAKNIFDEMEAAGMQRPEWQKLHAAYFSKGYLVIITREPCPEEEIFKRFAIVFDQTYTRFLDLKKAEAQAREAQIEAALEKVRSRSLAMQTPDELIDVVQLLREEMGALGVEELETSSIYIHDESSGNAQCWFTIKDSASGKTVTDQMTLNLQDTWVGKEMLSFYRSDMKQTSILMQGAQRVEWIRYCGEKSNAFTPEGFYGDAIPERTYHLYKFSEGFIGAASPGEISSESWDLLKRATSVFSFAYTRFRDLQKAETRAREARIELALERIRAQVASMQESSDLFDIVVGMRTEFLALGHEADYFWHMRWLPESYEMSMTSEDGSRIGMVISLPKFVHDEIPALAEWEKGNDPIYVLALDPVGAWNYIENMNTHGSYELADPNAPGKEDIAHIGGLTFIMARTTHGEIGYGLPGMVPDPPKDALDTLVRFAGVFDLAYRRFEDLKAAEHQALMIREERDRLEIALNELRATQAQLVQQEKLASLGQLTAGIAHEIKNPLNFVNNFSEVSLELIDEALEELSAVKAQCTASPELPNASPGMESFNDIQEILADVQSNLTKIHQHGSRANGIVSSMLQHSRGGSGKPEPTDLNALVKEYVNLAFHGMRAGKSPINVDIQLDLDESLGKVNLIGEDFSRVVLNMANNAFDAMREKAKTASAYTPQLMVRTKRSATGVEISVTDNGPGIPDEIKDKILQPFFTTKKGTEGTGLGLSITHDIIKAHGGELTLESVEGKATLFKIYLPTT